MDGGVETVPELRADIVENALIRKPESNTRRSNVGGQPDRLQDNRKCCQDGIIRTAAERAACGVKPANALSGLAKLREGGCDVIRKTMNQT